MNDEYQQANSIITEALESYPQVSLPPGLINHIMTQVETQPRVQPERFRLQFLDIALALCFGGIVALMLVAIFATFGILNLSWLSTDTLQSFSLINDISASARLWLILGFVLFTELGLGAGVCMQLWQDRPYTTA
jgi:hypothetical protein